MVALNVRRLFRVGDVVRHDLGFHGVVEHATPDGYGGQTLTVRLQLATDVVDDWRSWQVVLIERSAS